MALLAFNSKSFCLILQSAGIRSVYNCIWLYLSLLLALWESPFVLSGYGWRIAMILLKEPRAEICVPWLGNKQLK